MSLTASAECTSVLPITKVTHVLNRSDGSQAKIVVQSVRSIGMVPHTDVYVLRRPNPFHSWQLCSDRPHPQWRVMSVDDYVKRGRSEVLQTVTPAEILKLICLLGKPLDSLSDVYDKGSFPLSNEPVCFPKYT